MVLQCEVVSSNTKVLFLFTLATLTFVVCVCADETQTGVTDDEKIETTVMNLIRACVTACLGVENM